jgi:protease-4
MGADRIVAQPGTLTGSIGVIAGKPVLTDLLARLEVRWEGVVRGEHAGMWSPARPFLPAEESRLDAIVEALYRDFKAGVAAGRELPLEEVDRLAKGRVWTGQQAAALDLVDRLGGYAEALAELRQLLGLPADAPLRLRALPDRELRLREMLSQAGRYLESALAAAAGLRSLAQGGAVMAPLNLR